MASLLCDNHHLQLIVVSHQAEPSLGVRFLPLWNIPLCCGIHNGVCIQRKANVNSCNCVTPVRGGLLLCVASPPAAGSAASTVTLVPRIAGSLGNGDPGET
jgi:hypothetical protein